jgi:hypothetical protein
MLDRDVLSRAFDLLGADLARRGLFVEIAVYGGSAIMLQFAWRRGTEDVDAVVRDGFDARALRPSVAWVAGRMNLAPDWLNDAVGMFTPLQEDDSLFQACGTYPAGSEPGLRVLLARPAYLLAMKLKALSSLDRGDRDLADARALATHLGIASEDALLSLYVSIHGEAPGRELQRRFPAVLSGGGP